MILHTPNFLTNLECDFFIDCYEDYKNREFLVKDNVYSFYGINVIDCKIDYKRFVPKVKGSYFKNRLRVQLIKEGDEVNSNFHIHSIDNPNSFVIFLNDDFIGGELEFSTGEIFKPKKGDMVRFETFNAHRVIPVTKGRRYTLVGLLDKNNKNTKIGIYPTENLI